MAERSIIDQLDDAVAAMAEGRQVDLTNLGPELSALVEVAQDLIGLPRETFKAELQQQLIRRDAMSSPTEETRLRRKRSSYEDFGIKEHKMRRENRRAVTPYITVHKPAELIDFVTQAFGGIEHFRATGSAGGMHAEVSIGDSVVMIGGAEHIEPMPTAIHLYVPDVDQAYERALKAGAKSLMPVADQPYGERSGGVEDVHGNRWYIATTFVAIANNRKGSSHCHGLLPSDRRATFHRLRYQCVRWKRTDAPRRGRYDPARKSADRRFSDRTRRSSLSETTAANRYLSLRGRRGCNV